MEPNKKSNGALIGSIIVILILVVGGVYFWMTKMPTSENQLEQEAQKKALEQLEAAVIEADNALVGIENDIGVSGVDTLDLENVVNELE